jgi:anti-sigma B factor antagonist
MRIIKKEDKEIAILSLVGDPLGEDDAQLLRKKIHNVVQDDIKQVVIDLSGVKHINSAGLGGLIAAMCTMLRAGGAVFYASPGQHVKETFKITHLDQIFNTYETVEKAIDDYS